VVKNDNKPASTAGESWIPLEYHRLLTDYWKSRVAFRLQAK